MARSLVMFLVGISLLDRVPAQEERSLDDWLAYLRPSAEESRWREIPWRDQFAAAVVEARQEKKPLLIWAMNGHPLGCT